MSESGTAPFGTRNTIPDLGRIVDALQQIVRLQGAVYQQLHAGVAVLTSLPTYTVAGLPTVAAISTLAYASNGRKPGEGGGAGTGVPIWFDVSGSWFSVCSGTAVAA